MENPTATIRPTDARLGLLLKAMPCLALAVTPVDGAKPELVTDRPDQTESSKTVPPGRVQVEAGWTYSRDDGDGARTETQEIPSTLVRIGLDPRWELRAGWAGHVSEDVSVPGSDFEASGIGDTALGAKLYMRDERGDTPELALIFGASLPTGGDEVSSERLDPGFQFSASHTLSDRHGLGYNVGMKWASEEGPGGGHRTLSSYIYTAALGTAVSERTGAFVELFGEIPASAPGGPAHSVDGGMTYLVRDNLQLDLAGGIGLSDDADDWFIGIGVSARFPD
jgi:hypothetical protein